MNQLFGTDGIRGRANEYPITPELALRVGKAIATLFPQSGRQNPRAVIGKDTRLSGYMLETALTSGLVSMGMDVFEIGPMPTPAVAHLTRSMCADCGIMITASHNPASDNGIKIFDAEGFKLSEGLEAKIEQAVFQQEKAVRSRGTHRIGKAFRIDDARGRYIEFAKSAIRNHSLRGIKAVLDCANGAAYCIAPLILKELGVDVIRTATSPDGYNINDKCGATFPQNISRLVRESGADIGISLDGDADRVVFCDAHGDIVNGDRILGLCALDAKERGCLASGAIAVTAMSNLGLTEAMTRAGIRTEITAVSDNCVIERMREIGLNFGGDESGHLVFLDYATTGDGILAALHLIRIMKCKDKPLHELAAGFMEEYPRKITSFPVHEHFSIDSCPSLSRILAEAEQDLGPLGRILIRCSQTEGRCFALVESRVPEKLEKWNRIVCSALRKEFA